MSLSSHLKDPRSPVRQFVERATPLLSRSGGNTKDAVFAKGLLSISRLPGLAKEGVLGANAGTVGTAFDYRLRYVCGPCDLRGRAAAHGAFLVVKVFQAATEADIRRFFRNLDVFLDCWQPWEVDLPPAEEAILAQYCIVLALFESVYRSGGLYWSPPHTPQGARYAPDKEPFLAIAQEPDIVDLIELIKAARPTPEQWRAEIVTTGTYHPNPIFAGSLTVGGADADLVVGDRIIEIKTAKDLKPATVRAALLQLVGYVLLDWDDLYGVRSVGVFFARHDYVETWPIWTLITARDDNPLAWVVTGVQPKAEEVTER